MKAAAASLLATAALLASQEASAFVPLSASSGAALSRSSQPRAGRTAAVAPGGASRGRVLAPLRVDPEDDDAPKVYYASEIADEKEKTSFSRQFGDQGVRTTEQTRQGGTHNNAGPANYDGYVDGDSFDGGDGQTGCVGDGKMNLDEFASNEVVVKESMVRDSKSQKAKNAWGSNTGYADDLKKQGLVDIDESGEDKKAVRRQQFENWRNQQDLQSRQRQSITLEEQITGEGDYVSGAGWKKGVNSYLDNMSGKVGVESDDDWKNPTYTATGRSDGEQWGEIRLEGNEKVKDTLTVTSERGRPGVTTIEVKNTVMGFEPFHCAFFGDNVEGFSCSPMEGTLNRRSGPPIPIDVLFKGMSPGDNRNAKLVIETEEDKFVYIVEGRSQ